MDPACHSLPVTAKSILCWASLAHALPRMTRVKASEAGDSPGQRPEKENAGVAGVQKRNPKKKLSREALALMNASSVLPHSNIATKAPAPPAKGRPSDPVDSHSPGSSPQLKASNRGKKGMSAPPLPDFHLQQQKPQAEARPRKVDAGKAPGATEALPQTAACAEPETKRLKVDTGSDRHQQRINKADKPSQRQSLNDGPAATEAEVVAGQSGLGSAECEGGAIISQPAVARQRDKKAVRPSKGSIKEAHGEQAPGQLPPVVLAPGGATAAAADPITISQPGCDMGEPKCAWTTKSTAARQTQIQGTLSADAALNPARKDPAPVDGSHKLVGALPAKVVRVEPAKDSSRPQDQDLAIPVAAALARRSAAEAVSTDPAPQQARTSRPAVAAVQQPVAAGSSGELGGPAAPGLAAAAPRAMLHQQASRPGSVPTATVQGIALKGAQLASSGAAGDCAAGSNGSARHNPVTTDGAAATPLGARSRPLPPTGTTPVRAFIPVPMEIIGQHERAAAADLQNQLTELRALYDELKVTKIQEVEKIFAEHAESAEEELREANKRAALWQAAAERAEQKAIAAGSQEVANRIKDLEEQVEGLLLDKRDALRRLAQREKELARLQQENHNLRAQILQIQKAPDTASVGAEEGAGEGDAIEVAGHGEVQKAEGAAHAAVGANDDNGLKRAASSPEARAPSLVDAAPILMPDSTPLLAGGAAAVCHMPTPPPALGVPFPTPSMHLVRRQSLLDGAFVVPNSSMPSVNGGVHTACQRIVQMLPNLRAPTPTTTSRLAAGAAADGEAQARQQAQGQKRGGEPFGRSSTALLHVAAATALPTSPGASQQDPAGTLVNGPGQSDGVGVSTECQRIVQMLPSLRAPLPSTQSRETSGTIRAAPSEIVVESDNGADAGRDTPHAAVDPQCQMAGAALGSKGRRSTGSPIDGICGADQRKAGATTAGTTEDLSYAHGMGAPEARPLGHPLAQHKQETYSFVDLNPASAQKAARLPPPSSQKGMLLHPAPGTAVAEHASTNETQLDISVNGPGLVSRFVHAMAIALPVSPKPPGQALAGGLGALQPEASPVRAIPQTAVPMMNSGSVASNQLSSTGPTGLLARAMAQQQQETVVRAPLAMAPQGYSNAQQHGSGGQAAGGTRAHSPLPPAPLLGRLSAPPLVSSPAPSPGRVDQAEAANSAAPAAPVLATAGSRHDDGCDRPRVDPEPSDPAALSAKAEELERRLNWKADVLAVKPMHVRLTHTTSGVCIELEEVEAWEDEQMTAASGGDQPLAAADHGPCLLYTPVELGGFAGRMPEYYEDVFTFPKHQKDLVLNGLHKAIEDAVKN